MWFESSFTTPAVAAISFCLVRGTVPAAADILHVPGDFPTIQAAIDATMDGDEVEVRPATYNETIDFLGEAISVYSTDGPDMTILDATGLNTSVVSCVNLEGPDTVLDGFTVTSGNAVDGGGMLIEFSNPTVLNCIFELNEATRGSGMLLVGSTSMISGCTFSTNDANDAGGGVYCNASSPVFTGRLLTGNTATDGLRDGGGIANTRFSATMLTTCVFTANTADRDGGYVP